MSNATDATSPSTGRRKTALQLLKWLLFLVVLVFIAKRAWLLWQQGDFSSVKLRLEWLLPAGLAYALGWLPSVWFWHSMMSALGKAPSWKTAARAYYVGHLGKYVPGKAMVLVIRAGMVRKDEVPLSVGALTATYETLFLMAVALVLAVALSPLFLRPEQWNALPEWTSWFHTHVWTIPVLALLATVSALPLVSQVFSIVARKMTPAELSEGSTDVRRIPTSTLFGGLLAFTIAWTLHGLSLALTLRSLGVGWNWRLWPVCIAAVSLATSIGFLAVFAPGGLGVREGLLIETLKGTVGGPQAILASVMLRLLWFLTELLLAALLYLLLKSSETSQTDSLKNELP